MLSWKSRVKQLVGRTSRFIRRTIASALGGSPSWQIARLAGIRVHYRPELDGGGASFGRQFVPFLNWFSVAPVDRAFEWCAGPGFIGFSLLGSGLCRTLCLADINPRAVEACRRTIADNGLDDRVAVYRSDNLTNIPESETWDLVVANPPHFVDVEEFKGCLLSHDPDWSVHRQFFAQVSRFLKPGGVIVLQENNRGSTPDTFREMIESAGLEILWTGGALPMRTVHGHFYFLIIMRRGESPPPWLGPLPSA